MTVSGNGVWKKNPSKKAPAPVRQASVDRNNGSVIHGSVLMMETPLKCGRKVHHQCKSDLRSSEIVAKARGVRLLRKALRRPFMKMRAGRTQAVTKDITPKKRSQVGYGDGLLKEGGLALREQVREAIRGDAHGHVQCVKKNTKKDH